MEDVNGKNTPQGCAFAPRLRKSACASPLGIRTPAARGTYSETLCGPFTTTYFSGMLPVQSLPIQRLGFVLPSPCQLQSRGVSHLPRRRAGAAGSRSARTARRCVPPATLRMSTAERDNPGWTGQDALDPDTVLAAEILRQLVERSAGTEERNQNEALPRETLRELGSRGAQSLGRIWQQTDADANLSEFTLAQQLTENTRAALRELIERRSAAATSAWLRMERELSRFETEKEHVRALIQEQNHPLALLRAVPRFILNSAHLRNLCLATAFTAIALVYVTLGTIQGAPYQNATIVCAVVAAGSMLYASQRREY
jgi:hypothetical protein